MDKTNLKRTLVTLTAPVFFGYMAIGIAFGLLLVQSGYPWWLTPIMSVFMYAGAAQYMALGLFASGAPLITVMVTTLLVNIRHIVYGLSLLDKLKGTGKVFPYLVFALTDETYALLTGCDCPEDVSPKKFFGSIAVLNHIYWILGGIIGSLVGVLLPFPLKGIDFALTALFVVLLLEQIQRKKARISAIIGAVCAIFALFTVGKQNMIIVALAVGITAEAILLRKDLPNLRKEQ
ncbi:MAG: AzlC family ABC transporter permease [Spirochaetaceae bacterium]|nr:AzlC family ABC transporter permease [Spirochaetaceae bacterium]